MIKADEAKRVVRFRRNRSGNAFAAAGPSHYCRRDERDAVCALRAVADSGELRARLEYSAFSPQ